MMHPDSAGTRPWPSDGSDRTREAEGVIPGTGQCCYHNCKRREQWVVIPPMGPEGLLERLARSLALAFALCGAPRGWASILGLLEQRAPSACTTRPGPV